MACFCTWRKIAGEYDIDYRTLSSPYIKRWIWSMFGHGFDSVSDMKG